MEPNRILGMVCSYVLSRCNEAAYDALSFGTQVATHQAIGERLGVPERSVQNWRDEFDPVHDNGRQGWHKRPMYPSRVRVIEALHEAGDGELISLVQAILAAPTGVVASSLVEQLGFEPEDEDNAVNLRGVTGHRAEELFVQYHERTGRPAVGRLVDRRHEQCGYDFEIQGGHPVAVEVKGLAGRAGGVLFTDKEWRIAREMGDAYALVIVRCVATQRPTFAIVRDPVATLPATLQARTRIDLHWTVPSRTLPAPE